MSSSCFGDYTFDALDHVVVSLCERTVDFVASTWVDVFAFVVDLGWSVEILLQSLSAEERSGTWKTQVGIIDFVGDFYEALSGNLLHH